MESLFRSLDVAIQSQPMPPEFRDTKAVVLCNDCCARSTTKYHWLGVKCAICHSYNTVNLQILGNAALSASSVPARRTGAQDPAPPASVETALPASLPAIAMNLTSDSEIGRWAIAPRRRHSLHRQSPHYEVDARLARSLSPEYPAQPLAHLANRTAEDDSDDEHDILRFWARHSGDDDSKKDDDESEDDNGEDENSDASLDADDDDDDDDDDEDDDDEIVLIGHR